MYSEIHKNIEAINKKIHELWEKATSEGRKKYTAEETKLLNELEAALEGEKMKLPVSGPLSLGANLNLDDRDSTIRNDRGYALRGPRDKKDYKNLFGSAHKYEWKDRSIGFFGAVFSGRHHPELIRASMNETVPSEGGFLVPSQLASQIHAVSLENEIVMPRCFVQPMISNECKIPAMSIGDHSSNLYGGFTASYTDEAGTITEHSPKARAMELNAKKLTGLLRFSNELAQDIPGGEGRVVEICGKGLAWYRDKAFLKGTGAGQPLGILNSNCLIEVAKETGQHADTIMYENLTKMMSRMFAGSFANSVWVCHQTTIPELLTLTVAIGTGGAHIPVMTKGANGGFEILTRPVLFTEKTTKLGDKGDIMLCDFSQYVVGLRGEMRFDMSIHVHFTTDELLARLVERHDGQPLWDSALTLEDGSTTVSPFVTLAERA